jgi:uncharacterized YccA/Bax inhibitor family protein
MQSNNPVFRRSEEFNGKSTNAYGNQTYAGNGAGYPTYGQGQGYDQPGYGVPTTTGRPMTIDAVVQKTAISLFVVVVAASLTWWMTPPITNESIASGLYAAVTIGSLAAFGLSLANSFKRVISPALVLAFCAAEGVALGGLSKFFDAYFTQNSTFGQESDGVSIVTQAVVGTFAAFAGTLAAYKFFNIQVGQRFRTFVIAAMFGMVALSLLEVVLSIFGSQLGLFDLGGVGLLFSVAGLVLGVFMLILDFDFVERGIAAGIDEREAWRAAFGLTVSLVWIYTNLLRILAIFSRN